MKNSPNGIFLFIGMVIMAVGCQKPHPHGEDECQPIPETKSILGYDYHIAPYGTGPSFNPNNPNEIVYIEVTNIYSQNLAVYNLETKEKKVLHQGLLINNPQWGKSGWILFNTMPNASTGGYSIYKVRPDGSEKEILVDQNAFSPVISPTGNTFIYKQGSGANAKFVIMDMESSILQQCTASNVNMRPICWYADSAVLFIEAAKSIHTYNLSTCFSRLLLQTDGPQGSIDGFVIPPSTLVWCNTESGLYTLDINTGSIKIIIKSCNSLQYSASSYSPLSNKMIVLQTRYTTPDSINLFEKTDMILMNPDGSDEKIVDLGL